MVGLVLFWFAFGVFISVALFSFPSFLLSSVLGISARCQGLCTQNGYCTTILLQVRRVPKKFVFLSVSGWDCCLVRGWCTWLLELSL